MNQSKKTTISKQIALILITLNSKVNCKNSFTEYTIFEKSTDFIVFKSYNTFIGYRRLNSKHYNYLTNKLLSKTTTKQINNHIINQYNIENNIVYCGQSELELSLLSYLQNIENQRLNFAF